MLLMIYDMLLRFWLLFLELAAAAKVLWLLLLSLFLFFMLLMCIEWRRDVGRGLMFPFALATVIGGASLPDQS